MILFKEITTRIPDTFLCKYSLVNLINWLLALPLAELEKKINSLGNADLSNQYLKMEEDRAYLELQNKKRLAQDNKSVMVYDESYKLLTSLPTSKEITGMKHLYNSSQLMSC